MKEQTYRSICYEIDGTKRRVKIMLKEPIAISGLWFRTNAAGTRIDVLIEVDGKWQEVAELPGIGQGPGSHIIEPLGMREAIKEQKPIKVQI